MTEKGKRVKEVMDHFGLNKNSFSKEIGMSSNVTIGRILNEERNPHPSTLEKIVTRFPEVNYDWLLTGEGSMLKDEEPSNPYTINQNHKGRPYYDVDFINGFDLVANDQTVNPSYYIDFKEYENVDFWVNATGESMKPLINHGDIVALKQIQDWNTYLLYGEVYAVVTDEYRTIKKVRKSSKGDEYLRFVPQNTTDFDEQDVPRSAITAVFQVIGCAKKIF